VEHDHDKHSKHHQHKRHKHHRHKKNKKDKVGASLISSSIVTTELTVMTLWCHKNIYVINYCCYLKTYDKRRIVRKLHFLQI